MLHSRPFVVERRREAREPHNRFCAPKAAGVNAMCPCEGKSCIQRRASPLLWRLRDWSRRCRLVCAVVAAGVDVRPSSKTAPTPQSTDSEGAFLLRRCRFRVLLSGDGQIVIYFSYAEKALNVWKASAHER